MKHLLLLVCLAASLSPGWSEQLPEDHGRPVDQIANELGVTPEQFREAFRKVHPARVGELPTQEQRMQNRKILSETLHVSPERLDEVMDKYRPGGAAAGRATRQDGEAEMHGARPWGEQNARPENEHSLRDEVRQPPPPPGQE